MTNYTKIENNILEKLASMDLSGTELGCVLILLRKTNGFNKESDGISISQFVECTGRSRPTVCRALKRLQLVKIMILVKSGKSTKSYNEYRINKDTASWGLVKKSLPVQLVKKTKRTSKENDTQLVKKMIHTKDTIQRKLYKRDKPLKSTSYGGYTEFIREFNLIVGSSFRGDSRSKRSYSARIHNYTPEELLRAVRLASQNPYLMGQNDSGKRYLTPEYILREDKLEKWLNSESEKAFNILNK